MPYRMQLLVLVEQLELMFRAIRQFDDEIEKLASAHPDYGLFQSLPGAGPSLAPRLLVAFGEQRDRFTCAADLQKYSGIAPVTQRSGQKHWVHRRLQCPTFLRQTFVEWAAQTINSPTGRGNIIDNNGQWAAPTRLRSGHWLSNGYVLSIGAGNPE
jgi:transposase